MAYLRVKVNKLGPCVDLVTHRTEMRPYTTTGSALPNWTANLKSNLHGYSSTFEQLSQVRLLNMVMTAADQVYGTTSATFQYPVYYEARQVLGPFGWMQHLIHPW